MSRETYGAQNLPRSTTRKFATQQDQYRRAVAAARPDADGSVHIGHEKRLRLPEPNAILQAWTPFKQLIGVTSVNNEEDYAQARATIDALLDEVGDKEDHPLAEVLDYLANQVKIYEDENFQIPEAEPMEVLRFLMEQHNLKQEDLGECAAQSRISDILSGNRSISKEIAKRLAYRFHVRADLFL